MPNMYILLGQIYYYYLLEFEVQILQLKLNQKT